MKMSHDQIVAQLNSMALGMGKEDCRFWIEQYVYIEDRDAPEIAVKFSLWPGQVITLCDFLTKRLNMALKARQLGLSWLALAYAAWLMWRKPGVSVIVMSRGEFESKEMARRVGFIFRHVPAFMIGTGEPTDVPSWEMTTSTITVRHKGAEDSTLQSMPAGQNSGRSLTANLIILDEWAFQSWAEQIWASVFPSVNRVGGGSVIGISTMSRGSLFERLWLDSKDGKNDFNRIFLGWNTDPRRTPEWYEKTRMALGDAVLAEYPSNEDEAFLVPGGAFFPELREYIHLVPYADKPQWHQRVRFLDYGMDMLACYWATIDNNGRARVYREVYKSGLTISEACREILASNGSDRVDITYAPPDMWARRQDTGRPGAEIFANCGVPLYRATNELEGGWNSVHEWLLPRETRNEITGEPMFVPNLVIEEGAAPNLWKSMKSIQKDKINTNIAANQPHILTHANDALRYFCAARNMSSEQVVESKKDSFWDEPEEVSVTGGDIPQSYMGGWG